jgi:membrane protein
VLPARRLRILLTRAVKEFYRDGCGQLAASISYYVLFSIFPLLILSALVLGQFLTGPKLQNELVDAVVDYVPLNEVQAREELNRSLQHVSSTTSRAVGVIGFLLMAWSGANLFGAVRNSLNKVFDLSSDTPALRQKLSDFAMVAVFTPFFLASITASAALRFAHHLSEDLPVIGAHSETGIMWLLASAMLPGMISLLAFFTLYKLVPAKTLPSRQLLAGALVAALVFEMSKLGFALYVENLTNYDVVFGPLGTAAAFLSWVYFSASVMLFGAQVSAAFPHVMTGATAPMMKARDPSSLSRRFWNAIRYVLLEDEEEPRTGYHSTIEVNSADV